MHGGGGYQITQRGVYQMPVGGRGAHYQGGGYPCEGGPQIASAPPRVASTPARGWGWAHRASSWRSLPRRPPAHRPPPSHSRTGGRRALLHSALSGTRRQRWGSSRCTRDPFPPPPRRASPLSRALCARRARRLQWRTLSPMARRRRRPLRPLCSRRRREWRRRPSAPRSMRRGLITPRLSFFNSPTQPLFPICRTPFPPYVRN